MPYGMREPSQVMGIGSYVGEMRYGPDGQLYEWVEGVDGLGNPIGFWKKAFKAVGKIARGALVKLIPGPIKSAARTVCGQVDQLGPVAQLIPVAAPYVTAAGGFCRVLRGAGIAGVGEEEPAATPVPGLPAAAIPPMARSAAKRVCGFIDKLGPIVRFVPPVRGYYKKMTGLCTVLRDKGIAGPGDEFVQGPDGQLYEVVEGIGEYGEATRQLSPVWVSIPAVIRPRGAARAVPAAPQAAVPGTPAQPVRAARPVRRFR
ncbi:MAG: hypothetical protein SF339_22350 [Blastocatellia bacterium]|nr:hypothetical protein [Blastocatellia bacterium]